MPYTIQVLAGAPETKLRYEQARIKLLTQQVRDGTEIRQSLLEQVSDLQRQLKDEKEENKKMKKRSEL